MVNVEKLESDSSEIPDDFYKYFFTIGMLSNEIRDYAEKTFNKKYSNLDVMRVAIFTLYGIVFAETDADKEIKKNILSDMVENKYNLNEWLFSRARELEVCDETFYECFKTGNMNDLDERLDKAVAEAHYKAWHEELAVIKNNGGV